MTKSRSEVGRVITIPAEQAKEMARQTHERFFPIYVDHVLTRRRMSGGLSTDQFLSPADIAEARRLARKTGYIPQNYAA